MDDYRLFEGDCLEVMPMLIEEGVTVDCQKPVGLLYDLISELSEDKDIILDCFMGSGSTGVACANTGRQFIGIELEPKYYKIASERIKEAYSQRRLI